MVAKSLGLWVLVLGFLLIPGILLAETNLSVRLNMVSGVAYAAGADPEWFPTAGGSTEVVINNRGNSQVRGELRLRASLVGSTALVDVPRAWIRFRFPEAGLVGTLGRTRLTWGEGLVFNPGDLVNVNLSSLASGVEDLNAQELRSESVWLTALTWSFGSFSFLEGVVRYPDLIMLTMVLEPENIIVPTLEQQPIQDLAAGLRLRLPLGPIDTEVSYLWQNPFHSAAITAQFALGINWYLTGRVDYPHGEPIEQANGTVGFGFYDAFNLGGDRRLSIRLESLWLPHDQLRVLLFPDVSFSWAQVHSLGVRATGQLATDPAGLTQVQWAGNYTWSGLQGLQLGIGVSGFTGTTSHQQPDVAIQFTVRFVY
jgi:hypothetical protein